MITKKMLQILACPKCKGELTYDKTENKLICKKCRLKFKILNGDIPDLLIEDAERF